MRMIHSYHRLGPIIALAMMIISSGSIVDHPGVQAKENHPIQQDGRDSLLSFSYDVATRLHETYTIHPSMAHIRDENQSWANTRRLPGVAEEPSTCAAEMAECGKDTNCFQCFMDFDNKGLLFTVSSTTRCDTVLEAAKNRKICTELSNVRDNQNSINAFCSMFDACKIEFDKENGSRNDNNNDNNNNKIDCSTLKECDWPGIDKDRLSDGICHDRGDDGCYNTPVCHYDGGDCCQDTCLENEKNESISKNHLYFTCGDNGFYCRDPDSAYCDATLPGDSSCKNRTSNTSDKTNDFVPSTLKCPDGTSKYRIVMYDSFGDGWEETFISVMERNTKKEIYHGQLVYGSTGTVFTCLSNEATCYDVTLNGGMWGREISWEIRGYYAGSPVVATGGAPMTCQFGIAGTKSDNNDCALTCTGKPPRSEDDTDSDYKSLKDMTKCLNRKCFLQVTACLNDDVCSKCYVDDTPESCYSSDTFLALTDCTVCQCSSSDTKEFCSKKSSPGSISEDGNSNPNECSATEMMNGGKAVISYVQCTNFTENDMLTKMFDNEHFGDIDLFEKCAKTYATSQKSQKQEETVVVSALDCMQKLKNAMFLDEDDKKPNGADDEAAYYPQVIAELAKELYQNAEQFCDCSYAAYTNTTMCTTFRNFKTLLYESLDACNALDIIDCDAWMEFAGTCSYNLKQQFDKIDFTKPEQCNYIQKESCGGAGPFPAFRRLDCSNDDSNSNKFDAEKWNLYKDYIKYCSLDSTSFNYDKPDVPKSAPTVPPPIPSTNTEENKDEYDDVADNEFTGNDDDEYPFALAPVSPPAEKKPYVPPEERKKKGSKNVSPSENSNDSNTGTGKKKSHWFRKMILYGIMGYICFYIYNNRHEFSNYMTYQRLQPMNNYDTGGGYQSNSSWSIFSFFRRNNNRGYGGNGMYGNQFLGAGTGSNMMFSGGSTMMPDTDDMYTGLSMGDSVMSSSSGMFQSTSLPPFATSFMTTSNNQSNYPTSSSYPSNPTSGNYAI